MFLFCVLSNYDVYVYIKNTVSFTSLTILFIDPETFVCVKTDGTTFNFNKLKNSLDVASNIYKNKKLLKDAENEQHDIKILSNKLRKYNPTKAKKIKTKEETLSAAEKLLNNRQAVIDALKAGIFLYIDGFQIKEESEEELEEELEEESKEESEKKQKMTLKAFSNIWRMYQRA